MRLSDAQYSFSFLAGDWRELARCREVGIEMVPGNDGQDVSTGVEVQQAKQTCASCPVQQECLLIAGTQTGVWGGLTKDERDRLRLSNQPKEKPGDRRSIIKCEVCGYRCVPALKNDPRCDDCLPESARPQSAAGFKDQIIALIEERKTYAEIALVTGLSAQTVGRACREWTRPSKAAGRKSGSKHRDMNKLAPCGTPAARRRHQRRKEPIVTCACAQPGSWDPKKTIKGGWAA
jgi:transcription factor WhiB